MFTKIRNQLLVWNLLVLIGLLVALGLGIYFVTANVLYNAADDSLREKSRDTVQNLVFRPGSNFVLPRTGFRGDAFYLGIDPSGQIFQNPQNVDVSSSPDPEGFRKALTGEPQFGTIEVSGKDVRVYSVLVTTPSGRPLGVLQVGTSIESQEAALRKLAWILGLSEAGALLLAILGGWFLAGRAMVPITRAFDRQRRFVADASHELRTPLTLIRSSGELLARHGAQTVDQNRHLVESIVSETEYLNGLVSGLLTLAQSDAGRLPLRLEPVDLGEMAHRLTDGVRPLALERGLQVQCLAMPGRLYASADRERLRQLLLLLVDNAFKYTPGGGKVEIAVTGEHGQTTLAVKDTGKGIAPEHLPHIFDRFYRADQARGREAGGAGLGLSIAKVIVDAHKGTIEVESRVGAGTTVRVRLPQLAHDAAPSRLPEPGTPASAKEQPANP
ncbi:MAG: histidine kinase [Chloroflexi bacterium]|nr:histidine kinase [Chloroflexota bacterium]